MTKRKRAFTIIELLIVISIIAILSTVIYVGYKSTKEKSRDARRISDLNDIAVALGLYHDEYGSYPYHQLKEENCITNVAGTGGKWCTSGCLSDTTYYRTRPNAKQNQWIAGLVCNITGTADATVCDATPGYDFIASLPDDPLGNPAQCGDNLAANLESLTTNLFYAYKTTNNMQGYKLLAKPENSSLAANDGGVNAVLYEVFNAEGRTMPHP